MSEDTPESIREIIKWHLLSIELVTPFSVTAPINALERYATLLERLEASRDMVAVRDAELVTADDFYNVAVAERNSAWADATTATTLIGDLRGIVNDMIVERDALKAQVEEMKELYEELRLKFYEQEDKLRQYRRDMQEGL